MPNNLKSVALVDDICGYGKCSINVMLPTISAAGIEVCCGVTSVYTTHTPIKGYKKLETDPILEDTTASWRNLSLSFDAIYTGALSNKDQAYQCMQLFADQPKTIKICDPVLGDFGNFYDKNFESLLPHMKKLCSHTDIITPNITEAQLLCGLKSENPEELLHSLAKTGANNIILKGHVEDENISNYLLDENGEITKFSAPYYDFIIHGAGDFFSACIISHLIKNGNLKKSVDFATNITSDAVKFTISQAGFENKGISFETFLKKLTNL